jgi:hypothetical protein
MDRKTADRRAAEGRGGRTLFLKTGYTEPGINRAQIVCHTLVKRLVVSKHREYAADIPASSPDGGMKRSS